MRDEVKRALDQRLRDIHCAVWGRNFQLHSAEDRDRAVEYILSVIEPALDKAGLEIVPKISLSDLAYEKTSYVWQHDRGSSEKDTHTARRDNQVDTQRLTPGPDRPFYKDVR